MTDEHGKRDETDSEKRSYHRPRLLIYGDVNKLTRATKIGGPTQLDGRTIPFGMIFVLKFRS